MKCKSCNNEHNGTFGSGDYCNRLCANKRQHSEETRKRISIGVTNSDIYKIANKIAALKRRDRTKKTCLCGNEFEVRKCESYRIVCSRRCYVRFASVFNYGNGGYRGSSKKYKHQWYNSPIAGRIFLDSSWEVKYAEFLDKQKFEWKRNIEKFPYIYNGKEYNYIPDFYIPIKDEYVEIKGYMTQKDEEKIRQFPRKLLVLQRDDLKKLGIII